MPEANPGALLAGVAKIEITASPAVETNDPLYERIAADTRNDPLYAKALVLQQSTTRVALVTVDAVAVAEIGTIDNGFLARVRGRLADEVGLLPENVLVNASHCHGVVCADVDAKTVEAVRRAAAALVPVRAGAGSGFEDRIMENRRIRMKDGSEADVRRAYALPPDGEVEGIGPVDPEIGVLRLDTLEGATLAVVFNFACHPIQGVPSGGNTADISGFAARVVEEQVGCTAFFVQGCGADINPILYKDTGTPPDAEPLGTLLALSTLRTLRGIEGAPGARLGCVRRQLELPRADLGPAVEALRAEQETLLQSLQGTSLNFKEFVPLLVKYSLGGEYPSYAAHRYLHEEQRGRPYLKKLDADNREALEAYIANIHVMEALTRVRTNLGLLEMHRKKNREASGPTVGAEVMGLRVGDFVLVSFPGELPVEIGLGIKARSPHPRTFVAGVTNGYLFYTPTTEQMENRGRAQEDSDCLVAAEWQALFEAEADEVLRAL